eukprot:g1042.t1
MDCLEKVRSQLAPKGVLRAGISLSNKFLVHQKDRSEDDYLCGVSPSMARSIARALAVPLKLVAFKGPGEMLDGFEDGRCDIANFSNQPKRAKKVHFTRPYCQIEASFLVREERKKIQGRNFFDREGVRIVSKARSAYTLWLEDNIKRASIVLAPSMDACYDLFVEKRCDLFAGLKPSLASYGKHLPGSFIWADSFTHVGQAVGCKHGMPEAHHFLDSLVETYIEDGTIERMIAKYAPPGSLALPPSKCDSSSSMASKIRGDDERSE